MADAPQIPDEATVRAEWGGFQWTPENAAQAEKVIARYPAGRQHSAVMPLLDLAQRQVGAETNTQGWLPVPVIEYVAASIDMPYMRAYEVATFYTMYNLAPVGRFHVQVCGTTPCQGVRPARPRRGGLPDRLKWSFMPKECEGPPALSRHQRRRIRARHLQGPRDHAPRSAQADRGRADRRLRDARACGLHLHPRRIHPRARGAAAAVDEAYDAG
jgi:hypothetical protein